MLRTCGERARERWQDERFEKDLLEKSTFADNTAMFPGAQFLMPLVTPLESTIFDYVDSCVMVLDEPDVLREEHDKFLALLKHRYEQATSSGSLALPPESL